MPGAGRPMHPYELIGLTIGAAAGGLFAWIAHAECVFAVLGAMIGFLIGGVCTWAQE